MFNLLPDPIRGFFSLIVFMLNTVFWSLQLLFVALLKLLIPSPRWRLLCEGLLTELARNWVAGNNLGLRYTKDIRWDVQGLDGLQPDQWYLVVANHQSWVDIVVLQKILHRKAPLVKFFLKKELIWVPVLGVVWWALDFPFMRRSSSVHKDFETTRKACEKFRTYPVSIMNFLEGTRFTEEKKEKQKSPYKHLLKPKAAGIALVLDAMGKQIKSILDVTIAYPEGVPQFWEFLCCRSLSITVRAEERPITEELLGDFLADRMFRRRFNSWLDGLWREKDNLLETLLSSPARLPKDAGAE